MTDEIQPKEIKKLVEPFKKGVDNKPLLKEMLKDEDIKEALNGLKRALLNIGISIADFIPGIGDAISIGADVAKLTEFDLTPDVSKAVAWGTELLEPAFAGSLPSHAIETAGQLKADIPRIKKGLAKAKKIWTAHQKGVESTRVAEAALVFDTNV